MKTNKKKLLRIEGDKIEQIAFLKLTEKDEFSYDFDISCSVAEAKEAIHSKKYDIVISDCSFGDGTVFDIIDELEDTPIVVTARRGDEEIAIKALKLGAFDYLIKDIDNLYLKMLPVKIEKILQFFQTEKKLKEHYLYLGKLVDERTIELKNEIKEYKNSNKQLHESEEMYRITTEATGDVYYRLNFCNMQYEYMHSNIEKLTGYLPRNLDFGNIIMKIERRGEAIDLDKMELMRKKGAPTYSADYLIRMKNGEKKWITDISFPYFDNNGNEVGSFGLLSDITARKKMEKELLIAKEKAEKADKMKSIFLAQMSHEIRTPINALVSMSSLLRFDFEESANQDQLMSFDIIDRAGSRIIRTVDLLLNLSEIQAGTYETNPIQFNVLSDVLSVVIAENRKKAENKKLKLSLNSSSVDTEIVADLKTVSQIFIQLIDNAIKYTVEGDVIIKTHRNEKNQLVVEVKDTGVGIDTEYLPNLFNPFSQEEMGYTRKFEGNGIGLTLVKKYCEINNADLEVKSKKGVGSSFGVTFN
jgi:PAS domain S-box-containing protein